MPVHKLLLIWDCLFKAALQPDSLCIDSTPDSNLLVTNQTLRLQDALNLSVLMLCKNKLGSRDAVFCSLHLLECHAPFFLPPWFWLLYNGGIIKQSRLTGHSERPQHVGLRVLMLVIQAIIQPQWRIFTCSFAVRMRIWSNRRLPSRASCRQTTDATLPINNLQKPNQRSITKDVLGKGPKSSILKASIKTHTLIAASWTRFRNLVQKNMYIRGGVRTLIWPTYKNFVLTWPDFWSSQRSALLMYFLPGAVRFDLVHASQAIFNEEIRQAAGRAMAPA